MSRVCLLVAALHGDVAVSQAETSGRDAGPQGGSPQREEQRAADSSSYRHRSLPLRPDGHSAEAGSQGQRARRARTNRSGTNHLA